MGTDATRYFLAAFSPDTAMTFDLEAAKAQSMDNPVYYLQYAHARVCSLERFASAEGIARNPLESSDLSVLTQHLSSNLGWHQWLVAHLVLP